MDEVTHNSLEMPALDLDSPWKEVLEQYFEPFVAFFFPRVHQGVDWTRPHRFLDKELLQVTRQSEHGRRYVDKLVQVHCRDGEQAVVLVHVEVQGQVDAEFAERMYVYHYRLFDHHRCRVVSLAVLADESPSWRPSHYGHGLWGCRLALKFPTVKLLDYRDRWPELDASENPFAMVVQSHLAARATRRNPAGRYRAKKELVWRLLDRGWSEKRIRNLLRFIDWVLALPEELELTFQDELSEYEQEQRMPYVTSFERIGIKKGRREGRKEGRREGMMLHARRAVLAVLEARFAPVPQQLQEAVEQIDDVDDLDRLHGQALRAASLAELEGHLQSG